MIRGILKTLAMPPASLFLMAMLGGLLLRRRPRTGRFLIGLSVVLFYALSLRAVSVPLQWTLESEPPWDPARNASAIVVLSGDVTDAKEYGGPTVGDSTFERLRYAAWLHRKTGAPILVTGGSLPSHHEPPAPLMKAALEKELGVPVRWVEDRSRNTWENARYSAEILEREAIRTVYVVTHASHMRRARLCFEAAGLEPVPAPTAFAERLKGEVTDFLPTAGALKGSAIFFHEWLGIVWYRLFYF